MNEPNDPVRDLSGVMTPIPVPERAKVARPQLWVQPVGPPRGMSDEEVGTVEALVGSMDGMPVYADYWRPTQEQLDMLNAGGFIELIQYTRQMAMHSMTVWADERPWPPLKMDEYP